MVQKWLKNDSKIALKRLQNDLKNDAEHDQKRVVGIECDIRVQPVSTAGRHSTGPTRQCGPRRRLLGTQRRDEESGRHTEGAERSAESILAITPSILSQPSCL